MREDSVQSTLELVWRAFALQTTNLRLIPKTPQEFLFQANRNDS